MSSKENALSFLESEIGKADYRPAMSFDQYLELAQEEPQTILRSIFQLFYDMVKAYVGEGEDEYPDDPESIGFVKYDCSKLFAQGTDNPFFADRLFANRFVRQVESLRQGFQQNRIYAYEGPSGCGKSTFLNNLLSTFAAYTNTKEGQSFEILWELDDSAINPGDDASSKLVVPCPSHDSPILIIPREHRADFLDRLIPDGRAVKARIFNDKDYEWLFRGEVCTICKSIFELCLEKLSMSDVLGMLKARPYKFDRRLGEGISILNPGDSPLSGSIDGRPTGSIIINRHMQERLDEIFGANAVKYVYSSLAKTNHGIYVLMDIKSHNKARIIELHNVISEGVHKVGDVEERINSLFFALMNPEDKSVIAEEKMESLEGRIQYNVIPFVLEPSTEVAIYKNIFGEAVEGKFLPRVLENFARVIIASRMSADCQPLKQWIPDMKKYEKFCDEHGLLLRMEIYMGVIPDWLDENDEKTFTAPVRRALVAEGEKEGVRGFSGRDSIGLFSEFFNRYGTGTNLITMDNVDQFFKHSIGRDRRDEHIPKAFLASLIALYDYAILGEIKESIYFYNTEQISKDVLNYLYAINFDLGTRASCPYTGEDVDITLSFLKLIGSRIAGKEMSDREALDFAKETQKKYSVALSEPHNKFTETELYEDVFSAYVRNLRENALQPFVGNENFREAIKAFGTREFDTFDTRLKEHVEYMLKNLIQKFGYSEQGAKEICLYALDKNLTEKFAQENKTTQ